MQLTTKGKNFEVSDRLKAYGERKVSKLDKYFNHIISADIEFTDEAGGKKQNARKVEVTLNAAGNMLRAEETGSSFYAAVDSVAEKLERQLRKFKTRIIDSRRSEGNEPAFSAPVSEETTESPIVRVKKFTVKPMSPEEAVLQMDLSGHDFYIFRNSNNDSINVVYRRRSSGYGLLVPDVGD